jgi:carboxymethylenebutenolidase
MSGAVDYLLSHPATSTSHVGVVGYCMGGGLALVLASRRPDAVQAVAPYYGLIPWPDAHPDWSAITATVRGHYAANDEMFNPAAVAQLQETLDGLGKDAVLTIHPGTDHAFFNDTRPEVYDPSEANVAFADTVELFRTLT